MAKYDDPRILRAIAHPARNRILSELQAAGSMRAADVARTLDIPANQASFHLRQLAKYGLVEEAPEEARDKRDRVWRMSDDDITISGSEVRSQPGGEAAFAVYQQSARAWGHQLVELAHQEPVEGRIVVQLESALRLSSDEVTEFSADLSAVLQRWRERTRGHDDERRTYSVYQLIQPHPELSPLDQSERDVAQDPVRVIGFGAQLDEEGD